MIKPQLDCLIVGGGPAGLTAAIYLARFHLRVAVVDEGRSRALLIPKAITCRASRTGYRARTY
ncbi:FAD-dependent oxidoreductase [Bosea vestrisii]|uniref:FAD-dependent oxidoreductase n=1 Tax=Bosea vestrisii TaxID=151416 RepID=UPI0024DFFDA3|nr:FAD-dependent oxidoreductase [Bosea vestrisii]WID99365.1 FAD-dependent oxidoreductase [Bosea vestrisii]